MLPDEDSFVGTFDNITQDLVAAWYRVQRLKHRQLSCVAFDQSETTITTRTTSVTTTTTTTAGHTTHTPTGRLAVGEQIYIFDLATLIICTLLLIVTVLSVILIAVAKRSERTTDEQAVNIVPQEVGEVESMSEIEINN